MPKLVGLIELASLLGFVAFVAVCVWMVLKLGDKNG
jgi:hypothetical protein